MKNTVSGVFTPWAEILCLDCNNDRAGLGRDHVARTFKPFAVPADYKRGGTCDACGRDIALPERIAVLAWIRKHAGGRLDQTGGMCAALVIETRASGRALVVTAEDGPVSVVSYPSLSAWDGAQETGDESKWIEVGESSSWREALRMIRESLPF